MRQLIWAGFLCTSAVSGKNLVYSAGDAGKQRINDVHALSDGTFLVAGQSEGLDWLPAGVPRTTLRGRLGAGVGTLFGNGFEGP